MKLLVDDIEYELTILPRAESYPPRYKYSFDQMKKHVTCKWKPTTNLETKEVVGEIEFGARFRDEIMETEHVFTDLHLYKMDDKNFYLKQEYGHFIFQLQNDGQLLPVSGECSPPPAHRR